MQALEPLFALAEVAWIDNRIALAVGQEHGEAHVNANLAAGVHMLDLALYLDDKLNVVAVGPTDETYPLDLLEGEGGDLLTRIAHKAEATDATTIREGDMPAIRLQLPARLLVLSTPVVMLEGGIALFAGLLFSAIVVEAGDGGPGAGSGGLPCLRVEPPGKGVLAGQLGAEALEVVLAGSTHLHPEVQRLVANELDDANSLLNSGILLLRPVQLVFIAQHSRCACLPLFSCSLCILFPSLTSGNAPTHLPHGTAVHPPHE